MFDGETDVFETLNGHLERARSSQQNLGKTPILSYLSLGPVDMISSIDSQREAQPEHPETADVSETPLQ